jgi:molybdenum cofactor cytidylyltransferase
MTALSNGIGAVLICLGDMPLINPSELNRIISAYDPSEGREIIIPSHDGQRGNPVLWGRRFFNELLNLSGDSGAKQILHKYMEYVSEIPIETDSVLRDFDTTEALKTIV